MKQLAIIGEAIFFLSSNIDTEQDYMQLLEKFNTNNFHWSSDGPSILFGIHALFLYYL